MDIAVEACGPAMRELVALVAQEQECRARIHQVGNEGRAASQELAAASLQNQYGVVARR
jgi:hypothetical protein